MLDAAVYLEHGHVFANSMTGNMVLLGISALSRDWLQTVRHITPFAGFFAGVIASKLTRSQLGDDSGLVGLAIEMVTLFLVSWLPHGFPQMAFTALIAFVCAYQVASFRRVRQFSYNSTFVTGNLLDAAEGLYDGLTRYAVRRKAFAKARDLGLISLCFLGGAIVGGVAAPRLHDYAFWLPEPLLLIVLLSLWRRRARLTMHTTNS